MYCKNCGNELGNSAKYCPYCGTHLEKNEVPNSNNYNDYEYNNTHSNYETPSYVQSDKYDNYARKTKLFGILSIFLGTIFVILAFVFYGISARSANEQQARKVGLICTIVGIVVTILSNILWYVVILPYFESYLGGLYY